MSAIFGMARLKGLLGTDAAEQGKRSFFTFVPRFNEEMASSWQSDTALMCSLNQWITPESEGEFQPLTDKESGLTIAADVILDNRDELFASLQVKKDMHHLISDCRLILMAYRKWGVETPKHLIGDFAFLIWDEKNKRVFAARDYSGTRTLYFTKNEERIAFSSTMKPLLHMAGVSDRINRQWMAEFIAISTLVEAIDMSATVYEDIGQVPPCHFLLAERGRITIRRYRTFESRRQLYLSSDGEYEEAFREVLGRAVNDRLRSRGRIGSYLSGGLDSGSVASLAAPSLKKQNKKLYTFSYVPVAEFENWTPSYFVPDETDNIKTTVTHIGSTEPEFLDFEGMSPYSELDDMLDVMEMPYKFFENAFWMKRIPERAAEKGVNVLLNGARGNYSISWGNLNVAYDYYQRLLKTLQWSVLNRELTDYCRQFSTGKRVMIPFLARQIAVNLVSKMKAEVETGSWINPELARETNVFEKVEEVGINKIYSPSITDDEYRRRHFNNVFSWNKSGTLFSKLSYRYGVWDRDPTNDLRVVKFCLSIPPEQYVNHGLSRSILRRAMKGFLPDSVLMNQQNKGLQGADVIHRMRNKWPIFINELYEAATDPVTLEYADREKFELAIQKVEASSDESVLFTDAFKTVTRVLIVHRFLHKTRKEVKL
ncbi:asparagine synthase-related protein [Alteribacter natronophilus]|uniref:asparagine synthase-related protein n=1 Tax=Alteribacter natronophilus TaxID=2583810 RepID=UPI00110DDF8A|nr:asparagine synthase-related protein [Alteribacter natronophilus]TMW70534.1 asparagine synthetase B [Alteribacter natronophilus]